MQKTLYKIKSHRSVGPTMTLFPLSLFFSILTHLLDFSHFPKFISAHFLYLFSSLVSGNGDILISSNSQNNASKATTASSSNESGRRHQLLKQQQQEWDLLPPHSSFFPCKHCLIVGNHPLQAAATTMRAGNSNSTCDSSNSRHAWIYTWGSEPIRVRMYEGRLANVFRAHGKLSRNQCHVHEYWTGIVMLMLLISREETARCHVCWWSCGQASKLVFFGGIYALLWIIIYFCKLKLHYTLCICFMITKEIWGRRVIWQSPLIAEASGVW